MPIEYLFDYNGNWIAFRKGIYLFNTNCEWIGWFPWDNIAVDTEGKYLGTVYKKDRFLYDLNQRWVPYPGYPGHPSYPGYPGYPGYRGFCGYLSNAVDIQEERLQVN